jgi:CHAT domain-containing protein
MSRSGPVASVWVEPALVAQIAQIEDAPDPGPVGSMQQLIAQGVANYDSGRFAEAIAQWQRAIAQSEQSDSNRLTKAYLLSNISSAYQHLAQPQEAENAIAQSLAILQSWSGQDLAQRDVKPLEQTYWEVSARVLNTQGQSQWQQGDAQQALATWKQAEANYRSAQDRSGQVLTQINQAMALQELGFNAEALQQLTKLTPEIASLDAELQLVATQELGKALRRVGELSTAQSVLQSVLAARSAMTLPDSNRNFSQIQLELGHTTRALSHRMVAGGKLAPAIDYAEQTITAYTAAAQLVERPPIANNSAASNFADNSSTASNFATSNSADNSSADNSSANSEPAESEPAESNSADNSSTAGQSKEWSLRRSQAQLNQLSYLIEIGQLARARAFWPTINLSNLPLGQASVEAHISYAHSLACLQAPTSNTCITPEWQEGMTDSQPGAGSDDAGMSPSAAPQWEPILSLLTTAVSQAKTLQDPLLESYAIGELGHVYELNGQWQDATRLTEQALSLLEGRVVPDASYRWEWQLGRLYRQKGGGDRAAQDQAIAAYGRSLTALADVRQNLLLIDPQVQFSFRDNVEPIYREFVSLLLNSQTADDPDQASLRLAAKTLDSLQLSELENFLGCNLSALVNLSEVGVDPKAAKIYPIILPDQLAIIFDIPNQPLTLRRVPVAQAEVENTLKALRQSLTLPGKTPEVITTASQVYQWLITPLEPLLAANPQIETLVFVPDGLLRNIPMGVLYDGDRYLIEKDYALAIAPQLNLFTPRRSPQPLKILSGGIGLPQTVRGQNFPAIKLLESELEQIPSALTVDHPLLNEAFTKANIEQQLANQQYSAIHWKTHGVFSSNPADTFLVAYQDGITANELSTLVRSASARQSEPLELLVLSACATAQGDRRAVLGLAGMAIRAGTRSTLSTLWRADDGANTELMTVFYQGLNEGLSKAKALQKAQQGLLSESGYPAPYYWASYVLVGNWL